MSKNARKFLSLVLPTPTEGAHEFLNIHWSSIGQNGKKFWDGRACGDVDEAIRTLEWLMSSADVKDIYVCMSTQSRFEEKISKRGYKYKKALRATADVVHLKSLFIDVDVKDGAYPDTRTALAALQAFIIDVGLPHPSAVVASGSGGFHVHWALDTLMEREEWQVLANALSRVAQEKGLMCDTQCTVDSARILRVPDTKNNKWDPPRDVKLLSLGGEVSHDEMVAVLQPWTTPLPARVTKIADNEDLGGGVAPRARDIRIEEVAQHCGFVRRTLGTGGEDNDNPLWFLSASLSTFVVDGREALHAMSNKHKDYVPADTDMLYDRAEKKRQEKDLGWPKCSKIASYGCKECKTCPLLKQDKSPLHFVLQAAKAKPEEPLPERFIRDADGLIYARTVDDQGNPIQIPVCSYPMTSAWLSNDPWTFHFTTRLENNQRKAIDIPCEVITAKDSIAKYLGAKGVFLGEKEYKHVKEFLVAWLRKLQSSKDSVISASPFGWSVVDGKIEGFAYGGRVWMVDTDRPAATPDPVLSYQYSPRGTRDAWDQLVKVVCDQKRPALNAILATGFAGPLVRFTGHPGLLLNAYSPESGIGKTTAMKVAQSIWGDPVRAMQGLNDTSNSVLNKMGHIKALPMYWDEIKSEAQVKRFCQVVFDLTGGREKSRLNADSTLKLSGKWQTIMTSASNDSLIDPMAREVGSTTAGLYRMFEYIVPPAPKSADTGSVQRLLGQLDDNFGHAGLIYSKFLGKNYVRVAEDVAKRQDELERENGGRQDERFWFGTMAVILKGAEYGNELGLTQIDVPALQDFLLSVLADMRGQVAATPSDITTDMNASAVLAEFLNVHRSRNTLVTNRIHVSKGKPPKDSIKVLCDITKLGDLRVQIGKDDRLIRISSTYFTEWIGKAGHSRISWTKKMEKEFGLKQVNGRLGGGTELAATATEYLLELDMNHPKLSQFIE